MSRKKTTNAGKLRIRCLDAEGGPLRDHVDIRLEHLELSEIRMVRHVDASKPLVIEGLHAAPQGFYRLEVDPVIHPTERRFVQIQASGVTEVELVFEEAEPGHPEVVISGEDGMPSEELEVGESLTLAVDGLRRSTPYEVRLLEDDGSLLMSQVLITDRHGSIVPTDLWPQLGFDDPRSEEIFTLDEAERRWAGRRLRIEICDDGGAVAEGTMRIPEVFHRPLVLGTDPSGRPRNGFVAGDEDLVISGRRLPFGDTARVFLVERRHDWRVGDPIVPVVLASGRPATADVEIAEGAFESRMARARELEPGAYDFIVRRLRYGYEDHEDLRLRAEDVVGFRRITGVVVREEFMFSKFVAGGCVNIQPISGRSLSGSPYFQYTNVFPVGADVWGALDPGALDPNLAGKAVALHVVPHKNATQWTNDPSLQHLAVLGGNANVQKFKTQTGCVNANRRLLWPGAGDVGEYDVVADFGNNTPDLNSFVPDHQLDQLDLIDGYVVAGFRIVPDPTVDGKFTHAGSFDYDVGNVQVTDNSGMFDPYLGQSGSTTPEVVPRRAEVFFPADVPGATLPGQISASQASYPLFLVVHGNSGALDSYMGYSYLLEHMAKNGFIAASIHLQPGMGSRGRAEMAFEHIGLLQGQFGAKLANSVAMMGHSRGGEAVVEAALRNQSQGLGHNIEAVISLAPTDHYGRLDLGGAAATPYLVVYGSMDGDVAGGVSNNVPSKTGFSLYDRAGGAPKSMVFVYGSTHGRYNTVWGDTDINAWWSQLDPPDHPKLINADAHQKIARAYMAAFCRRHLLGESQLQGIFEGEWVPPAVEVADGGKVRLYVQQEETTATTVDHFEGAHTPTSWQTSSLGAAVDDAGTLPVDPEEEQLHVLDTHSPHDTAGLELRWNGASDQLTFELPAANQDASSFAALAFRITQKVDSPSNPAGAQDLYATLADNGGTSRKVRVSKFAEIPEPHARNKNQYTKSALRTVRIPLHAYTIKVAGQSPVDLTDLDFVRFDFGVKAAGEIGIDSVQLTQ